MRWLWLILVPLTMAPTPGNVGGCGGEIELANAATHCQTVASYVCARRRFRGDFDMGGTCGDVCQREAEVMCARAATCTGANWPLGCAPTTDQTDTCERALLEGRRVTLVYSPPNDPNFPECNLCP